MKITIDIPDLYVETLSRWASVGRTLRTAEAACEDAAVAASDEGASEKFAFCAVELDALTPALEALHHAARGALWDATTHKDS